MRLRRPTPRRNRSGGVAGSIVVFLLAGTSALALVGFGTAIASRRVGEREAIVEVRTTTVLRAQTFVAPAVSGALIDGDPAAIARVDEVVRRDVLDAGLVRVKLWTAEGKVVYADEPALIGTEWTLDDESEEALARGLIDAEVSDLSEPENRYERRYGKLLEVYMPLRIPGGEKLLFEAYHRYERVEASGNRLWRSFAPISLGALVALQVVQFPLAWSLATRLRQRQREREGLLRRALEASDVERRQIASDLHDGVVQELAGVAFACRPPTGGNATQRPTPPCWPSRRTPSGRACARCVPSWSTSTRPTSAR